MKVKDALAILQNQDPEADLCVGMELEEDLKPGEPRTFFCVQGFVPTSEESLTFIDAVQRVEKNGKILEIKI